MKLYYIRHTKMLGYDSYDSAVVAAKSEEDAKDIHPSDSKKWDYSTWVSREDVIAELIGTAKAGTIRGVIVASFNAG